MRLPRGAVPIGGRDAATEGEQPYRGHAHFWERALSRRRFLGASAAVAGAVAGAELWLPEVQAAGTGGMAPKPIPGGFSINGELFHVFPPAPGVEMATIFDFDGAIGAAEIGGAGTAVNTKTGERTRLLFDVDMRFMQGAYVGVNGHRHHATFGFVWLDLYEGQVAPENQVNDFNPGIARNGVFWTALIPNHDVQVNLAAGTASMRAAALFAEDYHDFINAISDGSSAPATVSFDIHWFGTAQTVEQRDPDQRFTGSYQFDSATIAWSAKKRGFSFQSDPAGTSFTVFAAIGHERNGVFFS